MVAVIAEAVTGGGHSLGLGTEEELRTRLLQDLQRKARHVSRDPDSASAL
jgi:hypothetical protein